MVSDPIRHIVVLMMENRSFDQMLGTFQSIYPGIEGIDPTAPPRVNVGGSPPRTISQQAITGRAINSDPAHELRNVLRQIGNNCDGFIEDYLQTHPRASDTELQDVMGFYPLASTAVPAFHRLAGSFLICDHWFASVPSGTWPNRLFVHSGTSRGRVETYDDPFDPNLHLYDQNTIYELLQQAGKAWRIYHHGLPQSLLLTRQLKYLDHYQEMDAFYASALAAEQDFPDYVFIEPDYAGPNANDEHPPSDILRGEALIASVYNALRGNDALWRTTLFVLLFDEHGGFYDHMVPPAAIPPDAYTEEYSFDQLGPRIPALLISPWVQPGFLSTVFDHTSLLKYVCDKWQLPQLGNRAAHANSFSNAFLELSQPRSDTPLFISVPAVPAMQQDQHVRDGGRNMVISYGQYLLSRPTEQEGEVPPSASGINEGPAMTAINAARAGFRKLLDSKSPLLNDEVKD
jgi:phospholipase C